MRSLIWSLLLLCINLVEAEAQETEMEKDLTWSFSYLGHIGFQPGIRVGLEMPLMGKPSKPLPEDLRTWIIRPQAAIFSNPGDDRNLILNVETGIRKPIEGKNTYRLYSFGLGYLNQSKLNSFTINLANGNTDSRNRVSDHFLLPTLSYEYGWATHRKMSWFSKVSLGRKFFGNRGNGMMLFLELGIKLNHKKN